MKKANNLKVSWEQINKLIHQAKNNAQFIFTAEGEIKEIVKSLNKVSKMLRIAKKRDIQIIMKIYEIMEVEFFNNKN